MPRLDLPGLNLLRSLTSGRREVVVGLVDGPVNLDSIPLRNAMLDLAPGYENEARTDGPATRHGTFVASLLFGEDGICPGCCGLFAPILSESDAGSLVPADQFGLARALQICADHGSRLINVSAGQRTVVPKADAVLAQALEHCTAHDTLVIAAAGNSGCACAELPAAIPGVIAVGSHAADGAPSRFSNFGDHYAKGLLAPGEGIPSFDATGESATADGTSYAAAIVTGVAALLLSAALDQGRELSADAIKDALLNTAAPCPRDANDDVPLACLAGRLDVLAAMERLRLVPGPIAMKEGKGDTMDTQTDVLTRSHTEPSLLMPAGVAEPTPAARAEAPMPGILPSDCGCGGGKACSCGGHGNCTCSGKANGGQAQLVYALGTLDVDFGTEARRDAFLQAMPDNASPNDPAQLAAFLAANPVYEQGLTWVLRLDSSPIYAIRPVGTYARETAQRLREIYAAQTDQQNIDIVSVPGFMAGQVRLLSGLVVPALYPDLRGIYAWDVATLTESLDAQRQIDPAASLENFLNRVYYEFRNLGVTPQERALNYSATNAFQVSQVFGQALGNNMVLDGIAVTKSPICRPESDCWDVVLTFFQPAERLNRARMNYRFTVDVSDILPVLVGPVRSWAIY